MDPVLELMLRLLASPMPYGYLAAEPDMLSKACVTAKALVSLLPAS
jgi:hypothetical protein